jgi:hypothetical protein
MPTWIVTVRDIQMIKAAPLGAPMFTDTRNSTSLGICGRSIRPLIVAALCAAVVGVTPATAQAQTLVDRDAVADMIAFNGDDAVVSVPDRKRNDVTRTRLVHGATRVAIRVGYVDLKKGGDVQAINITMATNEVRRNLQLVAYPRHWSGETEMYDGKWRDVGCRGVRHTIDYRANFMKVSFPRKCAGNPRWVKFRVVAFAQDDGFFADDALSDRPIRSQDDNDLRWSGKVFR